MRPYFQLFSFTLEKGDSPFNHPFSNHPYRIFTLQKGDSPFLRVIHPYRRVIHPQGWMRSPFLKGESSFARLIHPSRRVIHPSKRVNGRVNRVNHPSKGEWGFARYTLAKKSTALTLASKKATTILAKMISLWIQCFTAQKK